MERNLRRVPYRAYSLERKKKILSQQIPPAPHILGTISAGKKYMSNTQTYIIKMAHPIQAFLKEEKKKPHPKSGSSHRRPGSQPELSRSTQ